MIRAKAHFPRVVVDQARFQRATDEAVLFVMHAAAEDMLKGMLDVIPVDTGMAQGSLMPLKRVLDLVVDIPSKPIRREDRKRQGLAYPNGKNFQAGVDSGFATAPALRGGRSGDPTYSFSFRTDVPHFELHDGWGAFELANEIFRKYVDENLAKAYPKVKDFVTQLDIVRRSNG